MNCVHYDYTRIVLKVTMEAEVPVSESATELGLVPGHPI